MNYEGLIPNSGYVGSANGLVQSLIICIPIPRKKSELPQFKVLFASHGTTGLYLLWKPGQVLGECRLGLTRNKLGQTLSVTNKKEIGPCN